MAVFLCLGIHDLLQDPFCVSKSIFRNRLLKRVRGKSFLRFVFLPAERKGRVSRRKEKPSRYFPVAGGSRGFLPAGGIRVDSHTFMDGFVFIGKIIIIFVIRVEIFQGSFKNRGLDLDQIFLDHQIALGKRYGKLGRDFLGHLQGKEQRVPYGSLVVGFLN